MVLWINSDEQAGAEFPQLPSRMVTGERRIGDGSVSTVEVFTIPLVASSTLVSKTLLYKLEAPIVCTNAFFHFLRSYDGGGPALSPTISLF